MLKFVGPLVVVNEIAPSRHFYEQLLGQKVKFDFGQNVTFEGGFAIHLESHYQALLGDVTQYPVTKKAHNLENHFEDIPHRVAFIGNRDCSGTTAFKPPARLGIGDSLPMFLFVSDTWHSCDLTPAYDRGFTPLP